MCVCVCVCVFLAERKRERVGRGTDICQTEGKKLDNAIQFVQALEHDVAL